MANGPEASPPAASVPTPQLTILGLMVKLETWWATESSVYIPTPVPGMDAASSRRLAPAGRGWAPAGPTAAADSAAADHNRVRGRWPNEHLGDIPNTPAIPLCACSRGLQP